MFHYYFDVEWLINFLDPTVLFPGEGYVFYERIFFADPDELIFEKGILFFFATNNIIKNK